MEWISEHLLQIIVVVAGAIAAYLNNRNREKNGEPADFDGDGIPDNRPGQFAPAQMDMDEAERTRRIQEEIRRKIAERRGDTVPPLVAPRPAAPTPLPETVFRRADPPPPLPTRTPSVAALQAAREEHEEALSRQRALEEQLRQLEARKTEARRQAAAAASLAADTPMPPVSGRVTDWVRELRQPGGARRAWVLREVLEQPVSLRR